MNTVDYLLRNEFSAHTEQEKLEIKRLGRHIPDNFSISQKGRTQNRNFSAEWFRKTPWLTGSVERQMLFCFPCILFGEVGTWTKWGFNDLKHIGDRLKKHDRSPNHITACFHLQLFGRVDTRIQLDDGYRLSIRKHNENVDKNRQILNRIIDAIKLHGAFEVALSARESSLGSRNTGVFGGHTKLMSELVQLLDNVLADLCHNTTVFKGATKTRNELLDIMYEVYLETVKDEIDNAKFVSIQVDDTTDVSCMSQLVIILRYLVNGEIKERLLGFHKAQVKTANAITKLITEQIQCYNLKEKLISQTYNGAVTLRGSYGGVQTQMKQTFPYAHFIHCYAHELTGMMEQACTTRIPAIRVFFANLASFPLFFQGSPKRVDALKKTCQRRLPWAAARGCDFQSQTVNRVYENREALVECLTKIKYGQTTVENFESATEESNDHIKAEPDEEEIMQSWRTTIESDEEEEDLQSGQTTIDNSESVTVDIKAEPQSDEEENLQSGKTTVDNNSEAATVNIKAEPQSGEEENLQFKQATVDNNFQAATEEDTMAESDEIENFQWDLETISKASCLLKWLEDEEFMYFLGFFNRVMPNVDLLYGIIQSCNISVDMVNRALKGFIITLTEIREELCESQPSDQRVPSTSKRRRTSAGSMTASCIEACDVMIMQAEDRFSSVGNLIPLQLVDPTFFPIYAGNSPTDKLNMVPKYYPMIDKDKLTNELQILYRREDFHDAGSCLNLLQFIRENNLLDAFSELYKLLQIAVTTPSTSTEPEQCFSTLQRILAFLKNTVDSDRLNALAMLSVHKDLVQETRNFNELVIDKFAHLENRRAEFLYKGRSDEEL